MKKHLATGLAVILPVIITFYIVNFFITLLTRPFIGLVEHLIIHLTNKYQSLHFLQSPGLMFIISQVYILLFLALLILLVGFMGQLFLMNTLFRIGDSLIHKIPFANKIYKSAQDVVNTLFSSKTTLLSKPVQISFPNGKSKAIGFITSENFSIPQVLEGRELATVYLPGTPNPMMGFVLLMPKEKTSIIHNTSEDAVKFIVSCGMICG